VEECHECNNIFHNPECFQRHIADGICQQYRRSIYSLKQTQPAHIQMPNLWTDLQCHPNAASAEEEATNGC
jgi:hypothetical protein